MAREAVRGRAGSDIELGPVGEATRKAAAYHAVPAAGRGRGVLVLDESGALSDFARDVCDRLARSGFAALAPDLSGDGAPLRIEAAVRHLLDDHATDGPRIGALAFEQGAVRLLEGGDGRRRIGCIVDCGGVPAGAEAGESGEAGEAGDADAWAAALPSVPTLLLFGERDSRLEAAERLSRSLASCRLRVLPGADAGFMNPARADRYAAAAAASAWDEALAFLEASL